MNKVCTVEQRKMNINIKRGSEILGHNNKPPEWRSTERKTKGRN